ncbi:MAG TPA: peptide chain release factor N(5)-glutamine methyltransferase [Methylocella sp.]|nr:peptide chain release factor N(5)-glutamine methyltransferase [Methylocella sp.]
MSGEPAVAFGAQTPRGVAFQRSIRLLREAGIESAGIDARVLLCSALGIGHLELMCRPNEPLGQGAGALESFLKRRLRREPVSRIISQREFWQSRFKISESVLDPRPETEAVVEAILGYAARFPHRDWRVLDLGTGSGALLCSILQGLPDSFGVGVDISPPACAVARENLAALGLLDRACVICGDWASALSGKFDLIVANPPYIARGAIAHLVPEVRDYDPRVAIDGGGDGLTSYRAIIPALPLLLAPQGCVAFELGEDQYLDVRRLLSGSLQASCAVKLDLRARERVILAWR